MDYITENISSIISIIYAVFGTTSLAGLIVGVVSFIKALKSEKRVNKNLENAGQDIKITREGIVQAFKDALIPNDIKVSINKQVIAILDEAFAKFEARLQKSESARTKMVYWMLRILNYTAANNKLTAAEHDEIKKLLIDISEEEQIVDTDVL